MKKQWALIILHYSTTKMAGRRDWTCKHRQCARIGSRRLTGKRPSFGCVSTCATTQLEACQYARRRSNDQMETCTSSRKEANTRTYLPAWERDTCVTLRLPLGQPFCACLSSCILLPLRMQPTHVSHCMRSSQVETQPLDIWTYCGIESSIVEGWLYSCELNAHVTRTA
jgi:hypothetical protein